MGSLCFYTAGSLFAQSDRKQKSSAVLKNLPENYSKSNTWVFVLAGQSNMAGRAKVSPLDTISSPRILTINKDGNLIKAREPLHDFEESMKGLDCGVSFANEILAHANDSVNIILIPVAVGGSSINKWIGDSIHRNIKLLSNFRDKLQMGANYGTVKAILWHQGESDATAQGSKDYHLKLKNIIASFRSIADNQQITVITGHIGEFTDNKYIKNINKAIDAVDSEDENVYTIPTDDFTNIGDNLHFDAPSQRKMGIRMAQKYLETLK
ncbi:acetylxylan esterase [Flavobacterium sp. GSB-24]|nr:acetylxylan esterase [Flavobacterium sp. GSB-24]